MMSGVDRISLGSFGLNSKRYGRNHRIGCTIAKFGISTQFVYSTRLGNFLGAVATLPVFRREGQNFSGLVHGFIDRIAGGDDALPIRGRHAITAGWLLVYDSDVIGQRRPPINASAQ